MRGASIQSVITRTNIRIVRTSGRCVSATWPKLISFRLGFLGPLEISSPSLQTFFTIHIIKMCRTFGWQRLYIPRDFHLLFLPTRHSRRGLVSSVLKARDTSSHPEPAQPEGPTTDSWFTACIMSESQRRQHGTRSSGIENLQPGFCWNRPAV